MTSTAERAVRRLARLEGNRVCPNCGKEDKFGFSTVCIKYKTFVCSMCKSSHQAISHRCKSIPMSTWCDEEVSSLEDAHGGGNDAARRTWLANAPHPGQGGRPGPGETNLNVHKRFVADCYEHRRYHGNGAVQPRAVFIEEKKEEEVAPESTLAKKKLSRKKTPATVDVLPSPPVVDDLLSFASIPANASAGADHSFDANFDAFSEQLPPSNAAPSPPHPQPQLQPQLQPQPHSNQSFVANFDTSASGGGASSTSSAPASFGFDFLQPDFLSSEGMKRSTVTSFPGGTDATPTSLQQEATRKVPVMSSVGLHDANRANAISMMGNITGSGMRRGVGVGMQNLENTMADGWGMKPQQQQQRMNIMYQQQNMMQQQHQMMRGMMTGGDAEKVMQQQHQMMRGMMTGGDAEKVMQQYQMMTGGGSAAGLTAGMQNGCVMSSGATGNTLTGIGGFVSDGGKGVMNNGAGDKSGKLISAMNGANLSLHAEKSGDPFASLF